EKRPLGQALQELFHATGISVLVDNRVADKADKTAVTATLHHVPLDTAVLLLANMADLKAVAIDNVLYVTTKANADALQVEQEKRKPRQRQLEPKWAAPAKTAEKGNK